jgi:hypothetical protein
VSLDRGSSIPFLNRRGIHFRALAEVSGCHKAFRTERERVVILSLVSSATETELRDADFSDVHTTLRRKAVSFLPSFSQCR